jgi:hypothetical protein
MHCGKQRRVSLKQHLGRFRPRFSLSETAGGRRLIHHVQPADSLIMGGRVRSKAKGCDTAAPSLPGEITERRICAEFRSVGGQNKGPPLVKLRYLARLSHLTGWQGK